MEVAERMLSAKTYGLCVVGALAAPLLFLHCAAWAAGVELLPQGASFGAGEPWTATRDHR
jgi:hypothetical protein